MASALALAPTRRTHVVGRVLWPWAEWPASRSSRLRFGRRRCVEMSGLPCRSVWPGLHESEATGLGSGEVRTEDEAEEEDDEDDEDDEEEDDEEEDEEEDDEEEDEEEEDEEGDDASWLSAARNRSPALSTAAT